MIKNFELTPHFNSKLNDKRTGYLYWMNKHYAAQDNPYQDIAETLQKLAIKTKKYKILSYFFTEIVEQYSTKEQKIRVAKYRKLLYKKADQYMIEYMLEEYVHYIDVAKTFVMNTDINNYVNYLQQHHKRNSSIVTEYLRTVLSGTFQAIDGIHQRKKKQLKMGRIDFSNLIQESDFKDDETDLELNQDQITQENPQMVVNQGDQQSNYEEQIQINKEQKEEAEFMKAIGINYKILRPEQLIAMQDEIASYVLKNYQEIIENDFYDYETPPSDMYVIDETPQQIVQEQEEQVQEQQQVQEVFSKPKPQKEKTSDDQ